MSPAAVNRRVVGSNPTRGGTWDAISEKDLHSLYCAFREGKWW